MRLLLINPKFPESFWSFRWAAERVLPNLRAVNPPLGLATLAALCPPDWDVTIVDENIESVPRRPETDLIGLCGMGVQFPRQQELLTYYRRQGYFVVAGGSYASLCPEQYAGLADTVVAGEAESIWKQFCQDFEQGEPKALYRETGVIDLIDSPVPRFDLLKLDQYANATLQFSRGCPFRCEFCDIIVMFGRKPRMKSLEQIGRELDELRRIGVRRLFFVDDNLIGHRPMAKELLRFLKTYQQQHRYTFSLGTEASLNLAQDGELLQLFRDANFSWVFIGIESPDPASLKETLKTQNLHEDILTSVRRIYAYGIDVLAGFIVGFDHDTLATFDLQYDFIMAAGIQSAMVNLLSALPKTPLYLRLQQEDRLIPATVTGDTTRAGTNIIPKNMPYQAMVSAYQELYLRLLSDRDIARRIRTKLRHLQAPIYTSGYSLPARLGILVRLVVKGILPGGPPRLWHFLRTFPVRSPSRVPLVIGDWIIGLSMRAYAEQYLFPERVAPSALEHRLGAVRQVLAGYLVAEKVTCSLRETGIPDLTISLTAVLDRRFFVRTTPRLERLLKDTPARLTLHIEALQSQQFKPFQHLLHRLEAYGDRISIIIDDELHRLLPMDLSKFNLVLVDLL